MLVRVFIIFFFYWAEWPSGSDRKSQIHSYTDMGVRTDIIYRLSMIYLFRQYPRVGLITQSTLLTLVYLIHNKVIF